MQPEPMARVRNIGHLETSHEGLPLCPRAIQKQQHEPTAETPFTKAASDARARA